MRRRRSGILGVLAVASTVWGCQETLGSGYDLDPGLADDVASIRDVPDAPDAGGTHEVDWGTDLVSEDANLPDPAPRDDGAVEVPEGAADAAADAPAEAAVDAVAEAWVDVPGEATVDAVAEAWVDVPQEVLVDLPAEVPDDLPIDEDVHPGDAGPDLPAFTPGGCNAAPFAWLPRGAVGSVVSVDEDADWLLPPETLDSLLGQYGFTAFSPLPYGTRLFRVRYRTQDRGVVHEATTLVGVPQPKDGGGGAYPTVLWLHGTTGFCDACAPSRAFEGAAFPVLMAALGYIGVAPDYLGMNGFGDPSDVQHPYLVGEPTAIACLDAVRAVHELLDGGTIADEPARPDGRVVPWGASQGGHAALWVDRLAGLYAPEFEVPATLALIPPADLTGEAEVAMKAASGGVANLTGFLVAAQRWYGHPESMAGTLTDTEPKHFSTALPLLMDTQCGAGDLFDGLHSIDQLYESAFLEALSEKGVAGLDPWGCYFRENSLTTTFWPRVGNAPVLFVLSEEDELVDRTVERAAFRAMCDDQGYRMQLIECAGAGHAAGAVWSLPEQRAWLDERLAGVPLDPAKTCVLGDPVRCSAEPR